MFTPASERLRLSLAALAVVGVVYAAIAVGLHAAVGRLEASGEVYPYKREDWLRFLLPTMWQADEKPLLILTGPSTVRENLLVEEFAAAFPDFRVRQGGISGGTLGDVMASLEYIERVYGVRALPKAMVLGLSPRFVAELPRTGRPFGKGLERYSPYYRVPASDPTGFGLARKSALEGAVARVRFLTLKQQPRHATATAWLVAKLVDPQFSERLVATPAMKSGLARMILPGRARHIGIHAYALELALPYKYRNLREGGIEAKALIVNIEHPKSIWKYVFAWEPDKDTLVHARIASLLDYAAQHDIDIFAVNMPEGSANRTRYHEGYPEQYASLLHTTFEGVPLLNLRCLLKDREFHDAEHARLPGARKVTAQVIGFMHDVSAAREAAGGSRTADVSGISTKRTAAHCVDPPQKEHDKS